MPRFVRPSSQPVKPVLALALRGRLPANPAILTRSGVERVSWIRAVRGGTGNWGFRGHALALAMAALRPSTQTLAPG